MNQNRNIPLVSVVIPAFNGELYLDEAIRSVLAQTYRDFELIVVDDSIDNPGIREVCGRYAGQLIYLCRPSGGASAARNSGIRIARGELIAFLDEDDTWVPEKLERQVAFHRTLEERGILHALTYTGFHVTDEAGCVLQKALFASSGNNYLKLLFDNFIGTPCTVMIPKAVLAEVGLFDPSVRGCEDYELWLRIAQKFPMYSVDEYLATYRLRRDTLSKDPAVVLEGLRAVQERVLKSETPLNDETARKMERRIRGEGAFRYKNAGYERLLKRGDAKGFREAIQKSRSLDPSATDLKTLIYYILSFVSVRLCVWLKSLRRRRLEDVRVDVNGMELGVWMDRRRGV